MKRKCTPVVSRELKTRQSAVFAELLNQDRSFHNSCSDIIVYMLHDKYNDEMDAISEKDDFGIGNAYVSTAYNMSGIVNIILLIVTMPLLKY